MNMQQIDRLVEVNSIGVAYNTVGQGFTPIIFIHGFPFDKSMWQGQLDYFGEKTQAIAYDIRGFGGSGSEAIRPASMELYAEDLIAFMDGLHIEKAIVCGLSMGGYILLNALNRFPDRLSAVILADTQCIADSTEAKEKRSKTIVEIETIGLKTFALEFVKNVFSNAAFTYKKLIVKPIRTVIENANPESVIHGLRALANRSEMCGALSKIEVPTLIICGKLDKITPVEQSEFMHENIPNSTLQIINKAGHMSNLEQPNHFNRAIADFIDNLPHLSPIKLYGNENVATLPLLENEMNG
jgi:3-oxoadipate enol-lactonase